MDCLGCATRHIRFYCAACANESIATKLQELKTLEHVDVTGEEFAAFADQPGDKKEEHARYTIRAEAQTWRGRMDHLEATLEQHRKTIKKRIWHSMLFAKGPWLKRWIVHDRIKEHRKTLQERQVALQKRQALFASQMEQQLVKQIQTRLQHTMVTTRQVHAAVLKERREACAAIKSLFGFHHTAPDQYRLRHFAFKNDWPSFFNDLSDTSCSDILGMAVHMTLSLASILHLTPPLTLIPQGSTSHVYVPKTHASPERTIPLYLEEDNFEWLCVGIAMLNYNLAFLLAEGLHITCEWHEMPHTWYLLHKLTSVASSDADLELHSARPFTMDFAKTLSVVKRAFVTPSLPSPERATTARKAVPSAKSRSTKPPEPKQQVSEDWEPL